MALRMPKHPELGGERNPLLEALAPFVPLSGLPAVLKTEPLKKIRWQSLKPEFREVHLGQIENHYWPVAPQLEVCADIQSMLRAGLMARNPLSKAEQLRINMLALAPDAAGLKLQSLRKRAGGAIVSAITGMGKSTQVERALAAFAPQQIIVHRQNKACGWSTLTQVAYLIADAPPNATRYGLFEAIIGALDRLLGTDYASVLRRQKNIDAGLVYVAKTLSIHRVGLLVIDESQEETLTKNHWGLEFILVFLGLMNLGIPVVLMGNPLAFTDLDKGAQLTRRFASHGWHELVPAESPAEKWWRKQFVVGEVRFSLCEDSLSVDEVVDASFEFDQGIPGLFSALWAETIRIALRRGGTTAVMKAADIAAAAKTPRFRKLAEIAKSIKIGNSTGRYRDLPSKPPTSGADSGQRQTGAPSAQDIVAAVRRLASKLKRQEARQKTKDDKDRHLRMTSAEDDLRRGTDAMSILASLGNEQGEMDI
ncbi:MAG: TniB family NTP-binding protein [Acidobacteria bacterium]|nr:TniB family NTP-binding protein [Acidobacteriota bacterium]